MLRSGTPGASANSADGQKRHLVLKSAHPSPLSASRGFFGNGHFTQSNAWLQERYGADGGIDWKSLGESAAPAA